MWEMFSNVRTFLFVLFEFFYKYAKYAGACVLCPRESGSKRGSNLSAVFASDWRAPCAICIGNTRGESAGSLSNGI